MWINNKKLARVYDHSKINIQIKRKTSVFILFLIELVTSFSLVPLNSV